MSTWRWNHAVVAILRGDCQPSAPLSGNMTSHFMTEIMPELYVRLRAGMNVPPLSLSAVNSDVD